MTEVEDLEKQFNEILTTLFGESTMKEEPLRQESEGDNNITMENTDILAKEDEEEITLYDVLNVVPNSRKTMNILFRKSSEINILNNHVTAQHNIDRSLLEKCIAISNVWEQEDKFSTSTMSSSAATLQLEAPVSFAWSNNNKSNSNINSNKDIPSIINAQNSTHIPTIISQKHQGEPMRQVLFKKVDENLKDLVKDTKSWDYIISGVEGEDDDSESELSDFVTGNNSGMELNNGSQSSFKVNPLAKFVATELPRQKKAPDTKKHKHKSKRGTFKWMWGSKSSKQKHKDKKKNEKEDGYEKEMIDTIKMKHSNISADLADFTVPSLEDGRGSSHTSTSEINRQQTNDLDFDLDTHSSLGTNPFENSAFSSQANSISVVNTTNNSSANNISSVGEIDLFLDAFNHPSIVIPSAVNSSIAIDDKNDEGNEDDDFGDFAHAGIDSNDISNNVSIHNTSREPSLPATVNATPPELMSFVPLQPRKKA